MVGRCAAAIRLLGQSHGWWCASGTGLLGFGAGGASNHPDLALP